MGSTPSGLSLWEMVRPLLPKKAKEVIIMGPFFDREAKFLGSLIRELQPASMVIGVEPETVQLCRRQRIPRGVRIVDASQIGRGSGYLHAKALWIEGEDGETALITGSANPSSPAWTEDESKRNAESVVVHRGKSAHDLAESLGIASIPSMSRLDKKIIQAIDERIVKTYNNTEKSDFINFIIAEAKDGGILLCQQNIVAEEVKEVSRWDQMENDWKKITTISCDSDGLFIKMTPKEIGSTQFLDVTLVDGHHLRAFVHHTALISKLSRTSKQQRFRDALDSLDGESPDLPTVIRLASNLIFDEDNSEIRKNSITGKGEKKQKTEDDKPLDTLSISIEETKQRSRQARPLRGDDLGYIIDTLIYRLGIGLRSSVELLEEMGPTEEEKIGTEDDGFDTVVKDQPEVDIAKICHKKIRTLVSRMLKQLGRRKVEQVPAHRSVDQLLAVLSVLREVRAQDRRMKNLTYGQSLVLSEERRRLLDGAVSALFGNKKELCRMVISALAKDPEEDFPRLIGLLLWMAWDCSLDARKPMPDNTDREELYAYAKELACLVDLFMLADEYISAKEEAERSIWRTLGDTERDSAGKWLKSHCDWGRSLNELYKNFHNWGPLEREPRTGDLALPFKESSPILQVVKKMSDGNVHFMEPGDTTREIAYSRTFVTFTEMPPVPKI